MMDPCDTCVHTPPKSVGGYCAGCDPSDPKYSLYEERQHQTGRKPDMDLKETVAAAKEEGLSYGEYVLKHSPPVTVEVPQDGSEPQVTQSEEPKQPGKTEKTCPVCGKSFLVGPTQHRKKYCSDACRDNAAKTGKPKPRAKTEPDTLCPANDQTAKADAGKAQLSLVPTRIIYAIARIREYGNRKYGDPENWRTVEPQRYRDAAFRHLLDYITDPKGVDSESGLPHLWHLACNIAFLCEMEDGQWK